MSQNGQTHFKNLAVLCIKGLAKEEFLVSAPTLLSCKLKSNFICCFLFDPYNIAARSKLDHSLVTKLS